MIRTTNRSEPLNTIAKNIIIMRHGKAVPDSPTGLDADRPLKRKGHAQSAFVGQWLAQHIDETGAAIHIASSFVLRAHETAIGVINQLERANHHATLERCPPLEFGHDHASTNGLADIIAQHFANDGHEPAEESTILMLIGHNPQLERLAGIMQAASDGDQTTADDGYDLGSPPLRTGEARIFELNDTADPLSTAMHIETIRMSSD